MQSYIIVISVQNTMKYLNYIFTTVGLAFIILACFFYNKTNTFLKTATTANGVVKELIQVRNSSNKSLTYKPLILFTDKNNKNIEFSSSSSSNPPSYSEGEKVQVLYNPAQSSDAKINTFLSIWGFSVILGSMGFIFFIVGLSFFINAKHKKNKIFYLKQHGFTIITNFQSVSKNTSLAVNGRNPFNIVSQYLNPTDSKLYVFVSDNIWFDPTEFIKSNEIKVLIDKKNFKKYHLDLSFLPEVSE